MKSIIKGIAAVAACAMTVTGLAACGSSSASGEKKLDFITGMATGSVHLKTLQSITDAFEKENPGVKINLIPSSQDFTQDIKVRLAARNAPDLWNTHGWSRDRYVTIGEDWAVGASKTGKNKDIALKYIDFLAEPENMTKLTKMTNNDSALDGIDVNLGKINDTYDYWVNEKQTRTVPFFDRIYLPDGMWDTLCKSTDGVITGQLDAKGAADQMSNSFTTMWAKKQS